MKRECVSLPSYVIGQDAYVHAAQAAKRCGTKAVLIGGHRAMAAGSDLLAAALRAAGVALLGRLHYGGGLATYENAQALCGREAVQQADVIFAMGGGSVSDTCKIVAETLQKPLMTCPTIASNCAPCTSLAIMYHPDGTLRGNHYCQESPRYVFIHPQIIAEAPVAYLRAGIGDALSKEPEVLLALRYVPMDQNLLLGRAIAAACTEPLLQYGQAALAAAEAHRVDQALEETILDIIVTTGLVSNMTVCKEFYYNTNLAHCFYYGATALPTYHDHAHGIWVSYGVLALLAYDGQTQLLERITRTCLALKLPVTLDAFGITPENLGLLVEKATTVPGWQVEGYPLSTQRYAEAILQVDRLGRALLSGEA